MVSLARLVPDVAQTSVCDFWHRASQTEVCATTPEKTDTLVERRCDQKHHRRNLRSAKPGTLGAHATARAWRYPDRTSKAPQNPRESRSFSPARPGGTDGRQRTLRRAANPNANSQTADRCPCRWPRHFFPPGL